MTLTSRQIEDLIDAVRETGRREIMPLFRNLEPTSISTKADAKDLVTKADRAGELALSKTVSKTIPKADFIGEKAVADDPNVQDSIASSICVIVDPIEGPGNYVSGLAFFGQFHAMVEKGRIILGLHYNPVMDDWVFALRGADAYFANETLAPRRAKTGSARPLATARAFLPLDNYAAKDRSVAMDAFSAVYQINAIRCSCHEYRLIAMGQADFLLSASPNPWDHAAGLLILEEAGGWARVDGHQDYVPTPKNGRVVAASCHDVGRQVWDICKCLT